MIRLAARLQRLYVGFMMWLIGRLLEAASRVDQVIMKELKALPDAFAFSMSVLPAGPDFTVQKRQDGALYCKRRRDSFDADLVISFKHTRHAFLILSFQESTARSFVNDRVVLRGEIDLGMIIVRCLDRMECLVLPKFIATRAVKRYPPIPTGEKIKLATAIYIRVFAGLFRRPHVK
jgi:hypothetical protein